MYVSTYVSTVCQDLSICMYVCMYVCILILYLYACVSIYYPDLGLTRIVCMYEMYVLYLCMCVSWFSMAEVAVHESNGGVFEATERHGLHGQGPGRCAQVSVV